jgi:hypothetical protein
MDRKRLGSVQQTDLTESRINDDFVFWLKNSGPNWLLAVLVVAAVVMGWNWWRNKEAQARDVAWTELNAADIPSSFRDVAARHADIDSIPEFALLNAADKYLQSALTGTRFDREANASDATLTPEVRTEWLGEADALYGDVIKAAQVDTTGGLRGFEVSAWFGRAAVAESRGDSEAAKAALENAKRAAGSGFEWLQKNADARLASLAMISTQYPIPPAPPAPVAPPTVTPGASNLGAESDALKLLLGDTPVKAATAPAPAPEPAPQPPPAPAPAPNP